VSSLRCAVPGFVKENSSSNILCCEGRTQPKVGAPTAECVNPEPIVGDYRIRHKSDSPGAVSRHAKAIRCQARLLMGNPWESEVTSRAYLVFVRAHQPADLSTGSKASLLVADADLQHWLL
jgi:hypothetical protein